MKPPPVVWRHGTYVPPRAVSLPGRIGKAAAIREAKARRAAGEAVVAQRRADRTGWMVVTR